MLQVVIEKRDPAISVVFLHGFAYEVEPPTFVNAVGIVSPR